MKFGVVLGEDSADRRDAVFELLDLVRLLLDARDLCLPLLQLHAHGLSSGGQLFDLLAVLVECGEFAIERRAE